MRPSKKHFLSSYRANFNGLKLGADAFAVKRRNGFGYTAVQLIKFHMCELLSVIIRFCREATEKHRVRLNFARTCNSMFFSLPYRRSSPPATIFRSAPAREFRLSEGHSSRISGFKNRPIFCCVASQTVSGTGCFLRMLSKRLWRRFRRHISRRNRSFHFIVVRINTIMSGIGAFNKQFEFVSIRSGVEFISNFENPDRAFYKIAVI